MAARALMLVDVLEAVPRPEQRHAAAKLLPEFALQGRFAGLAEFDAAAEGAEPLQSATVVFNFGEQPLRATPGKTDDLDLDVLRGGATATYTEISPLLST
jgi:hypothetical protein